MSDHDQTKQHKIDIDDLDIRKETILDLTADELDRVAGGGASARATVCAVGVICGPTIGCTAAPAATCGIACTERAFSAPIANCQFAE